MKNILTVNVLPTGKSGPLAKYITPELYVSAVTPKQISLVNAEDAEAIVKQQNEKATKEEAAADKEDGIAENAECPQYQKRHIYPAG